MCKCMYTNLIGWRGGGQLSGEEESPSWPYVENTLLGIAKSAMINDVFTFQG